MESVTIGLNENEAAKLARSLKIVSKMAEYMFVGNGHFVEAKNPAEVNDAINDVKKLMIKLQVK